MTADRPNYADRTPTGFVLIHDVGDADGTAPIGRVEGHGMVSSGCWHAYGHDGALLGAYKQQGAARLAVAEAHAAAVAAQEAARWRTMLKKAARAVEADAAA
jgi:hypothetical protein